MKRLISTILFFVVFSTCIIGHAFADDFSIRNGIYFGMSKQDVLKAEKEYGTEDPREGTYLFYYDHANIAGMDGFIGYYFMDNKKLTGIDYRFRDENVKYLTDVKSQSEKEALYVKAKEAFDTIDEVLSNKYEQIGFKDGKNSISYVYFDQPNTFMGDFYYPFYKLSNGMYGVEYDTSFFDLYGFKQYIVPNGDDYVEIVIMCYHWEKEGSLEIITRIHYRPISKEVMEETINAAQEEQEKMNNDL